MMRLYKELALSDKKKPLSIMLLMFLFLEVITVFTNYTVIYGRNHNVIGLQVEDILVSIISFIGISILVYYMSYLLGLYYNSQAHTFYILRTSGMTVIQLTILETLKFFMLAIPTFVLTLFLNNILIQLIPNKLKEYVFLSRNTLFIVVILSLVVFGLMVFMIWYFLCSNDIVDLLSISRSTETMSVRKKILQMPDVLYVLMFLLGIFVYFIEDEVSPGVVFISLIGAIGACGVLVHFIPHAIEEYCDITESKYETILVLSNLSEDLKKLKTPLLFLLIAHIFMVTWLYFVSFSKIVTMMLISSLVLIDIVASIGFMAGFISELKKHKKDHHILEALGIEKKDLYRLTRKEVLLFYLIMFVIVLTYIAIIFVRLYGQYKLSVSMMLIILLSFVVPFSVSFICVMWKGKENYEN